MLLRDLRSASFRGARFLVPEDDLEAGRNAIHHEYPDSSIRYVEDNGKILPNFRITAIVAEPGLPGKLRSLLSALDRPGPGTLRHPWYGNRTVMVDGTYSVRRSDRHSGYVEIDIPFAVTGPAVFPGIVSGIAAVVSGLASDTVAAVLQSINIPAPRTGTSHETIADSIRSLGSTLDRTLGSASSAGAVIATQASSLVIDPSRFADLVEEALRAPFADVTYPDDVLVNGCDAVVVETLAIRDQAEAIVPTTLDLADRQTALRSIALATSAASLCCLADAIASRTYLTADDVSRDESLLIERYETVYGSDDGSALSQDVSSAIRRIITEASEVLRNTEVRLPRLSEVTLDPIPASVLTYLMYDAETRLQQIVDLNLDQAPPLYAGVTTILEEQGA